MDITLPSAMRSSVNELFYEERGSANAQENISTSLN